MINNNTYDVAIIIDNAQIDTTEFPHYVVVDVPETGGYTVRAYVNDTVVTEKSY